MKKKEGGRIGEQKHGRELGEETAIFIFSSIHLNHTHLGIGDRGAESNNPDLPLDL